MTSGKVILGILAGIAAGATLGILFAPDKGSSTRKKITKKRDQYVDELGNRVNDLVDSVSRKFDSVKKEAARMVERTKAKVEEDGTELVSVANAKMK